MATRRSAALSAPSLYTAQDVARFCEVDLKTVHHWAERGKVAHFRTEGRHLRFRRNDVVRFLRAHGYPLPEGLVRVKPTVAIAPLDSVPLTVEELAKKLASRFATQRHACGLAAIAHVLADQPDAIVLSYDDPSIAAVRARHRISGDGLYKGGTKGGAGSNCEVSSPQTSQLRQTPNHIT